MARKASPKSAVAAAHDTPARSRKQAVVVIHGMGEQRPMETLRGLVEGLLAPDSAIARDRNIVAKAGRIATEAVMPPQVPHSDKYWIIPDGKTGSHELSRIRATPEGCRPTDFYELYYADALTGNTLQQFTGWVRGLLFRWPHQVPVRLAAFWLILWAASLVAVYLLGASLSANPVKALTDAWSKLEPERDRVSLLLAIAVFFAAALYMTRRVRLHVDNASTKPGIGTLHYLWSFSSAIAVPLVLAALTFYAVPWRFFEIPAVLLAEMAGKSLVCQAWILLAGWKTLSLGLAALIIWAIKSFGVPVLGDVARYVRAAPDAVSARQAIRERGVRLLETLHGSMDEKGGKPLPEYDRIVVVAHSLGSVVALDVMRFYWAKHISVRDTRLDGTVIKALEKVDEFSREAHDADWQDDPALTENAGAPMEGLSQFRNLQAVAWAAMAASAAKWRISDLVTLGSPLTHAEFLLARDWPRFRKLRRERQAPMCPPWLETANNTGNVASFLFARNDGSKQPHHGAMFSATRWTAIFDPARSILWGDFIGGPLRRNFGKGIAEVAMRLTKARWPWRLVTHTNYWDPLATGKIADPAALPADLNVNGAGAKNHLDILRHVIWRQFAAKSAVSAKWAP